ncbi:MAG: Na/Pi cotransporter family protein [Lachnospiraceae bacterium]|nr:Na/Pi cotransporter family protein [Lachnospiraceae bacterium]
MDMFYRIVSLLGGLALFLYGMRTMGDGLKNCSGNAMRIALKKVTDRPIKGFILGLLITCVIQSSTACIVLTVGLVGAGFLTFRQSVGVVLGAEVGTTITAQIIRLMDLSAGTGSILYFFKSDNLAPMALIVGIILIMFVRGASTSAVGTIFIGFGVLFVGLMNMSAAVASLGDSLSNLLTAFEHNYILQFFSGVLVTGIIQSSSAVIGILQTLASSVGVHFYGVFAVIVGVNIGDCLTTYLVCRIGAKPNQIRTCLVHIIYTVIEATLIFTTIAILRGTGIISDSLWNASLNAGGVANMHSLFRLIPAVILLPFINKIADLVEKIKPDNPVDEEDSEIENNLRDLDEHLIDNPSIALAESAHLIGHMIDVAIHNYQSAKGQFRAYDQKRAERIKERELLLDRMADAANKYIIDLSPNITLDSDTRKQSFQFRALNCFERIGDYANNIGEAATALQENSLSFSTQAMAELEVVFSAIDKILEQTRTAFKYNNPDESIRIEAMEEAIDDVIDILQENHIDRMVHRQCEVLSGIHFQNVLQNLERISDMCSDMAVGLLGRYDDDIHGQEHVFIHDLHHSNDPDYIKEYRTHLNQYMAQVREITQLANSQENPQS